MALTDPLGIQEDPEKEQQIPDYLGKESPLAFKGQPALPVTGAAAFGSPTAPAGPGGPLPDGMTQGMTGGTQGGFAQLAAKLMDSDLFKAGGGGDLGTRGETGGVSLSDELRSRGMGEFGAGASGGMTGLGEGLLSGFGDLGAEGSLGADSLSGLMSGASFGEGAAAAGANAAEYAGLLEAFQGGGWEGLMGQMPGFGLDPFSGWALGGMIKSLWDPDDAFKLPFSGGDRREGIMHNIQGDLRDMPTVLKQLEAGFADPASISGMSREDLSRLYSHALTGWGSESRLAEMANQQGTSAAGIKYPDMGGALAARDKMSPTVRFNMIAALDRLAQMGGDEPYATGGEQYEKGIPFGTALHAMTGLADLPQYKGLTAVAPWDPHYKGQGLVDEQVWEQDGSAGNYVTRQRSVDDPAEYLAAIGADPKLAETLGPMIEGAQPGHFMEAFEQIFGALNPNLGASQFGQLLAKMRGGGNPGDAGMVAEASGSGGFGDVAGSIFAPGQPPPFDPNNAGQADLAGGEQFAAQQMGVELPEGVA